MMTERSQILKDVADMLKAGESTVWCLIKNAELRAIDVGCCWCIAPEDHDDFLRKRKAVTLKQ